MFPRRNFSRHHSLNNGKRPLIRLSAIRDFDDEGSPVYEDQQTTNVPAQSSGTGVNDNAVHKYSVQNANDHNTKRTKMSPNRQTSRKTDPENDNPSGLATVTQESDPSYISANLPAFVPPLLSGKHATSSGQTRSSPYHVELPFRPCQRSPLEARERTYSKNASDRRLEIRGASEKAASEKAASNHFSSIWKKTAGLETTSETRSESMRTLVTSEDSLLSDSAAKMRSILPWCRSLWALGILGLLIAILVKLCSPYHLVQSGTENRSFAIINTAAKQKPRSLKVVKDGLTARESPFISVYTDPLDATRLFLGFQVGLLLAPARRLVLFSAVFRRGVPGDAEETGTCTAHWPVGEPKVLALSLASDWSAVEIRHVPEGFRTIWPAYQAQVDLNTWTGPLYSLPIVGRDKLTGPSVIADGSALLADAFDLAKHVPGLIPRRPACSVLSEELSVCPENCHMSISCRFADTSTDPPQLSTLTFTIAFTQLPESPLVPRLADPRFGFFTSTFLNLGPSLDFAVEEDRFASVPDQCRYRPDGSLTCTPPALGSDPVLGCDGIPCLPGDLDASVTTISALRQVVQSLLVKLKTLLRHSDDVTEIPIQHGTKYKFLSSVHARNVSVDLFTGDPISFKDGHEDDEPDDSEFSQSFFELSPAIEQERTWDLIGKWDSRFHIIHRRRVEGTGAGAIVYFLDKSVPKRWWGAVKAGVEAWQIAFAAAGYSGEPGKPVISAVAPGEPGYPKQFRVGDARYTSISFVADPIKAQALGPSVTDPRSGEIIVANIVFSSQWFRAWLKDLELWLLALESIGDQENGSKDSKEGSEGNKVVDQNLIENYEPETPPTVSIQQRRRLMLERTDDTAVSRSRSSWSPPLRGVSLTSETSTASNVIIEEFFGNQAPHITSTANFVKDLLRRTENVNSVHANAESMFASLQGWSKPPRKLTEESRADIEGDKQHTHDTFSPAVFSAEAQQSKVDRFLSKFLWNGVKSVIMHEVGHTLGLRHNFRASTALPFALVTDSKYITDHGLASSVMDYLALNTPPLTRNSGPVRLQENGLPRLTSFRELENYPFFEGSVGEYDIEAINFAYTSPSMDYTIPEARSVDKKFEHPFATDEDGADVISQDPYVNRFDLTSDPLQWARQTLDDLAVIRSQLRRKILSGSLDSVRYVASLDKVYYKKLSRACVILVKFIGGTSITSKTASERIKPIPMDLQWEAFRVLYTVVTDGLSARPQCAGTVRPARWLDGYKEFPYMVNPANDAVHPVHSNLDYEFYKRKFESKLTAVNIFRSAVLVALFHPSRLTRLVHVYQFLGDEAQKNFSGPSLNPGSLFARMGSGIFPVPDKTALSTAGAVTHVKQSLCSDRRDLQTFWINFLFDLEDVLRNSSTALSYEGGTGDVLTAVIAERRRIKTTLKWYRTMLAEAVEHAEFAGSSRNNSSLPEGDDVLPRHQQSTNCPYGEGLCDILPHDLEDTQAAVDLCAHIFEMRLQPRILVTDAKPESIKRHVW